MFTGLEPMNETEARCLRIFSMGVDFQPNIGDALTQALEDAEESGYFNEK